MTHALAAVRILSALGSIWAFVAFRTTIRRRDERERIRTEHRAAAEWLFTAIRGGR